MTLTLTAEFEVATPYVVATGHETTPYELRADEDSFATVRDAEGNPICDVTVLDNGDTGETFWHQRVSDDDKLTIRESDSLLTAISDCAKAITAAQVKAWAEWLAANGQSAYKVYSDRNFANEFDLILTAGDAQSDGVAITVEDAAGLLVNGYEGAKWYGHVEWPTL